MDYAQIERFKSKLENLESEINEALGLNVEATATVAADPSVGRLSRMDAIQSQQIAVGLKVRQQQQLLRVKNALQAIRNGSYGKCRRCGNPISLERLDAQPDAVLCIKCAESARP